VVARTPAVVHAPGYYADIGSHVFPMRKFKLIREEIVRRGLLRDEEFAAPEPATVEQVLRAHDRAYVEKLLHGRLSALEEAVLELPYSKQLVEASFLGAGGSVLAARLALERGIGINLAGGFHHAFPDHGEGFCVFNDVAIAIRDAQAERRIRRAAVIDVDVHQGNGTAAIFADDPTVYTFSIHEEQNYPAVKPPSDRDVGLDSGTEGGPYLAALRRYVPEILERHQPELVAYVAGADAYEQDQLGRLRLTRADLRERDRIVFGECATRGIPAVAMLAGGYAVHVEDTVAIHADMVEEAFAALHGGAPGGL
jgi:acetoin utilization deacetylase AcuC-like enzyme